MENIVLQKVTIQDLPILQQIARQTFEESFSAGNTAENMAQYLNERFSKARLAEELSNSESRFYFALLDGQVIGYLKLNTGKAQTELEDEKALEIERIYVLGALQGKKVGQLLYEKAMEVAEELHAAYVWLGVWEENRRAIEFYRKHGFVDFDRHIFKLGEDEQTDILMKKHLPA